MKTPIVFSLVRDQSVFMTVIIGLLTFLAVLSLGIALAIGTGVSRWNAQWDLFATVQVTSPDNRDSVKKIIEKNNDKIETVRLVSTDEMKKLLSPWISGGNALENYLPQMYEIKFKNKDNLTEMKQQIGQNARFLTHAQALKSSTSAGWKMMLIAGIVLTLALGAISACIIYIARNTALLHRRELEILNQIGASDTFIASQMQRIVAKICLTACGAGFLIALPILMLILSTAHSARVGLMATLGLGMWGWTTLIMVPFIIIGFSIFITKRTTLELLKNN